MNPPFAEARARLERAVVYDLIETRVIDTDDIRAALAKIDEQANEIDSLKRKNELLIMTIKRMNLQTGGWYSMMEREHVKESMLGSYAGQRQIAACYHEWNPRYALLFGYMKVNAQCTKCKTWWSGTLEGEDHK